MKSPRKNRTAFRPSVGEARLEDRLALSGTQSAVAAQVQAAATQAGTLTVAQLRAAALRQMRTATQDLRSLINTQIDQLFANGTPTTQQLADFNQFLNGAVDATAFRVSSQAALLPGS